MEKCLSNRVDELAIDSEGKQANSKSFLLRCPFLPAASRCGPDVGWVFPPHMIQSQNIPHRCAQLLRFYLVPKIFMLTIKISHLICVCVWGGEIQGIENNAVDLLLFYPLYMDSRNGAQLSGLYGRCLYPEPSL